MSEHSLPADLNQWPQDPFTLLNVERGAAPKELKRGYTRLIKVYKPEQFPEHFRRIREAYESALRLNEFFSQFGIVISSETASPASDIPKTTSADPAPPATDAPETTGADAAPHPAPPSSDVPATEPIKSEKEEISPGVDANASPATEPRPASFSQQLADMWERAIRGEEAEAYNGLLALHRDRPHQSSVILRLYWLLSLDNQLDATRRPVDWLATGLKSCGPQRTLKDLYRREIESDPGEAVSPRFSELLELEEMQSALPDFYLWRFGAIRRLSRWDILASDLQRARERILRKDQTAWLRLLLAAADATAWVRGDDLWKIEGLWKIVNLEIRQMEYLLAQMGSSFDDLDFLTAVRNDWIRVSTHVGSPTAVLNLVADSWNSPFHLYQPTLLKVLDQIDDDPKHWLAQLDNLLDVAPALLGAFGQALKELENRLEFPDTDILSVFSRQFVGDMFGSYAIFREMIMAFCFAEGIDSIRLGQMLVEKSSDWKSTCDRDLFIRLANDWPLHYVCLARRLFWS